jgi:hypothetical protein
MHLLSQSSDLLLAYFRLLVGSRDKRADRALIRGVRSGLMEGDLLCLLRRRTRLRRSAGGNIRSIGWIRRTVVVDSHEFGFSSSVCLRTLCSRTSSFPLPIGQGLGAFIVSNFVYLHAAIGMLEKNFSCWPNGHS